MENNFFLLVLVIVGVMSVRVHAADVPAEPARPAAAQARRFLRLIICVDDDGQEDIGNPDESRAITVDFAIAVHQASAPILVSPNLLRNFLIGQRRFEDVGFRGEFERISRVRYADQNEEQRKLLSDYRYHYLYYNIPFTDDQWDVYQFRNLFLLIPHSYKKKAMQEADIAVINQMKLPTESVEEHALGFKLSAGEKKTVAGLRARAQWLPQKSASMKSFAPLVIKTDPQDLLGTWNIYLVGHGIYAKDMQAGFVPTPDKPAHTWHDELGGSIAGISITDFRNTLRYLTEFVNVNMLVYNSCYAGDTNTILPYVQLYQKVNDHYVSPIQPNFIVVSGAITDTPTYAGPAILAHQIFGAERATNLGWETYKAYEREKNYTAFFASAELFFGQKKRVGAALSKSPLRDILQHITPRIEVAKDDPLGIAATPLIRFPGLSFFRAVDVDDRLLVLTHALVTKHELENRPIMVNNKDAILLYTHAVRAPITITVKPGGSSPAFVSMISGEAFHYIKEVDVQEPLTRFLSNSIGQLEVSPRKKFFVIERLSTRLAAPTFGGILGAYGGATNIKKYYGNVLFYLKDKKEQVHMYQKLTSPTSAPTALKVAKIGSDGDRVVRDEERVGAFRLLIRDIKREAERKTGADISAPLGAFAVVRTEPLTEQEALERRAEVQKALQRLGDRPTPGPKPGQRPKLVRPQKPEFLKKRPKPQRPEKPQWVREKAALRAGRPGAKPAIPAKPQWVKEKAARRAQVSKRKTLSERIKLLENTLEEQRIEEEVDRWAEEHLD